MPQKTLFDDSTPPPLPDRKERETILKELGCNMLVEAAAGTGKTTSIVGRMVAVLRQGKCRIGTMAAVTFTRKAAAELRGRFQIALERAVRKGSAEEADRLRDALGHVEQCFIGTIHSFCARLLRERPVEAGVDLAFEEMDDVEDARLRKEAWDACAAQLIAHDADGALAALARCGLRLRDLEGAFLRFADYPDVDEWPAEGSGAELPGPADAAKKLREYAAHMQALWPNLPNTWGNDKLIPEYRRLPRVVSHHDLNDPAQLAEVLAAFAKEGRIVQKEWMKTNAFTRDEAKAERGRWNAFRDDTAQPFLRAWLQGRYPAVLHVMFQAREIYDALRRERGQLNYQDLLMKAAALLRNSPHVRRYFQARFTHLLVDEFQDTDPIQAAVMLLLTATDVNETDWRRCRPRPGSLFVVGDPKQSIYRFRRADIVTYNDVRDIIAGGSRAGKTGRIAELHANFRSTGAVIDWVNRVFEKAFPEAPTELSPAHRALKKGRVDGSTGRMSGAYVLKIPAEHSTREAAVEYEADRIARTIRHAIDSGATIPRTQQQLGDGALREAGPGDFMIVTRNRTHLSLYAQKLQEYGVPHQVTGGAALNEVGELRLLHVCLDAVVQPDNSVAVVAVLRSELFGVSDADLYAFRKAGGRFDYHAGVPKGLPSRTGAPIRDAFDRLRKYAEWLKRLPPLSAIELMVADLGLTALAAARPGGDVQAGSLAKALEVLRKAQAAMWSGAHLAEYIGQLVEMEERYDGVSALSEEKPAVRVMNLHKVKGLEAPVVFLADPGGESNRPAEIHIDRSGPTVRGAMAISKKVSGHRWETIAHPHDWDALAEKEGEFLKAEALRLRYVAATRAGAALIVTQRPKRDRNNPWQHFAPQLENAQEIADPGPQAAPAGAEQTVPATAAGEAERSIRARLNKATARTHDTRAAKAYALSEADEAEAAQGSVSFSDATETPAVPPEGEHGQEWGSVIHQLLELAMKNPEADLARLAAVSLPEHGLEAERAEEAASVVRAVMRSKIWQRAIGSRQYLTEVPFQILRDPDGPVPTVLRGAIDLVFREDDGWVLVDYKTDRIDREGVAALTEKYAPQVRLYADAWQACTGERVKEMGLFFSRAGEFATVQAP